MMSAKDRKNLAMWRCGNREGPVARRQRVSPGGDNKGSAGLQAPLWAFSAEASGRLASFRGGPLGSTGVRATPGKQVQKRNGGDRSGAVVCVTFGALPGCAIDGGFGRALGAVRAALGNLTENTFLVFSK